MRIIGSNMPTVIPGWFVANLDLCLQTLETNIFSIFSCISDPHGHDEGRRHPGGGSPGPGQGCTLSHCEVPSPFAVTLSTSSP